MPSTPASETQSAHESPPATDRRAFLAAAGLAAGAAALGLALPSALARGLQPAIDGAGAVPPLPASPFAWAEIREGIFASTNIATGGNCLAAAGGGAGNDGALLVDTKFPAFAAQIARDVEALTGGPVARVVNTHHHGDHTGGNLGFTGSATVIAHANAAPRVRAQLDRFMQGLTGGQRMAGRLEERFRAAVLADIEASLEIADGFDADSWAPTETVTASRTGIDLGGSWVELRHFLRPSHTDNDLIVHLTDHNVVHTGDVVFNGVHPFFDANGGTDSAGWIDTLADIAALCDADTAVVPGHGPVGDVETVRTQGRYIEQLRESVKKAIDTGTPLDELRTQTFPFMEGMGFEGLRENAIVFVYNELTDG